MFIVIGNFLNVLPIIVMYFPPKGKVGGWKERFTVAQSEFFDGVYKEEMEGTGIEFDFEL